MQPTKSVNTVIMAKAHPLGGGRGNMYKVLGSYDWNEQVIAKATCDWADVCDWRAGASERLRSS